MQAQLDGLSGDLREQLARIEELHERAGRVQAVAQSRDRLISVMVGAQGQLRGLDLAAGVYERLSPQRLAAAITELAEIAAADAAKQVREIIAPLRPAGLQPGRDLAGVVPQGLSLLDGGVAGDRW
jgi:hypothetical protein